MIRHYSGVVNVLREVRLRCKSQVEAGAIVSGVAERFSARSARQRAPRAQAACRATDALKSRLACRLGNKIRPGKIQGAFSRRSLTCVLRRVNDFVLLGWRIEDPRNQWGRTFLARQKERDWRQEFSHRFTYRYSIPQAANSGFMAFTVLRGHLTAAALANGETAARVMLKCARCRTARIYSRSRTLTLSAIASRVRVRNVTLTSPASIFWYCRATIPSKSETSSWVSPSSFRRFLKEAPRRF